MEELLLATAVGDVGRVTRNRRLLVLMCLLGAVVLVVASLPPGHHVGLPTAAAGNLLIEKRGGGGGASFGVIGSLKSLPMFYTDTGNGPTPATYTNLRPLVGYVSHANTTLGGWMYDGILFFAFSLATTQTQAECNAWTTNLFAAGGWLDTLNTVVGDLGSQLGDTTHMLNVFLTTRYVSGQTHGNMVQNDYTMVSDWTNKSYAHLSLAGFYWMFEEPSTNSCDAQYANQYLHSQGLGLTTVWIPYYGTGTPQWEDLSGYCNGLNWEQWGFDYVVAQPNYAFYCLRQNAATFSTVNSDLAKYPLAGVEFEIAYTDNRGGGCSKLSIEENANAYLDAGFQYAWFSNALNVFYYAPSYLTHYADGTGSRSAGEPQTYDRAIYDRQQEFIHGYTTATLNPSADTYVVAYYPNNNYGTDSHLFLGTNAINIMRTYAKWNLQGTVPLASYVTKAMLSLYLQAWSYGSSITDGQLYSVPSTWTSPGYLNTLRRAVPNCPHGRPVNGATSDL